jgi:2-deoxy-D-gluconate 3-dehydrogenase
MSLGTRGIGQTMVLALAQAGADIILVQRATSTPNYETRDKVTALGRKVHIVECDLADKAQVKGLCKKVTGSEGEGGMGLVVDIVVNCGGIQRRTPAENFPDEDWEEVRDPALNTLMFPQY